MGDADSILVCAGRLTRDEADPVNAVFEQTGLGVARLDKPYDARLKASGVLRGWQDHAFEAIRCVGGSVPRGNILATAPQLDWQAKVVWIVRGWGNLHDWIVRRGGPTPTAHAKNISKAGRHSVERLIAADDINIIVMLTILAAHSAVSRRAPEAGIHV